MNSLRFWFQVFFIITIIGALNWGLVAINPQNDVILFTFPNQLVLRSILYSIVGFSGIIACFLWLTYPTQICNL